MTQTHDRPGEHWLELAPSPKWVRVMLGGEVIASSKRVQLLREIRRVPVYYFTQEDVRMDLLLPSQRTAQDPDKGYASYWTARVGERVAEDAVWGYPEPSADASGLKGYVAFEWGKMDAWFEENEEVFVHARDPYKRIDVLPSSRHVQVVVSGETVAESHSPVLLFEPGHPHRYYLPKLDVRMDLLRPSERVSRCPYKGEAHYYSLAIEGKETAGIVWCYRHPTPEASKVAGLLAFYNERVDAIYVDGEEQPKPPSRGR